MYKKLLSLAVGVSLIVSCQQGEEHKTKQVETKKETKEEVVQKETVKVDTEEKKTVVQTDGEAIFKAKGCGSCHQPNVDTVGPSLKTIAQKYKSGKDSLLKFLKGEGEAIVWPEKFGIMKPQLNATKSMSDEELSMLADFILKH